MKQTYCNLMHLVGLLTLLWAPTVLKAQDSGGVVSFAKGGWHVGLTASAVNGSDENVDNLLYNVIDNDVNGFEIDVMAGYFFKEALSGGLRYRYSTHERDLTYEIDGDEAMSQSARANHNFTAFLRNYYPISPNKRFSFFNETDLVAGFGNRLERRTKSTSDITKTYTDEFDLKIGLRPGVAVVLVKGFAFEVSLDLLGMTYSHDNITQNGVKQGTRSDFNFDFDISLLSLDFGLAYYF